ncbi:MAG: hypothetical protein GY894_11475 [Planctomycetes bacterium]|nr:hypothetical protein [Planctomycetota bacterium]
MLKRAVFVGSAIAAGLWAVPEVSADAPVTDAIVFYSAGVDSILANPKDANLHAALVMMEKNGLSLPPDVGDDDAAIINFLASVILSELDVRMTVPSVPQGQMPFGISVSSKGNAGASPDVLMDRLHAALKGANARTAPSKTRDGFMTMASQYGPPTLFGIEDGSAVFAINGDVNMESIDWSGCGLPAGVDPLMGGIIDFNAMQPFLGMAAMFQPQAAAMMGNFGIMGPDAIRLEFAMGRGENHMHLGGRIANYGKHFGTDLVAEGVRAADLKVVPTDAVDMQVTRFNLVTFLDGILMMADSMAPPMGADPDGKPIKASDMVRQQAKMMLGVDIKTELIDYLGDSFVVYRSISTGGGGLTSLVTAINLSNPDGMATSLGNLSARVNAMAMPMTQGYVQLSSWSHRECGEVISLTFPGVPIPLELSLVVKGDWLLATLTPQAMVAACRQLDGTTSVLNNPRFASAVGSDGIGAVQVSFTDLPSQLADGYGIATGIMNAISNYTRPRENATAGIPLVMPPYFDLIAGASPCVVIARIDGDDLVYSGSADSSINVLITGAAANIVSMLPFVAPMAVAVTLPAITRAQEVAKTTRTKTQAKSLAMACQTYRTDNGAWPESLNVLVEEYYIDSSMLENAAQPGTGWKYRRPGENSQESDVLIHGIVTSGSSHDVPAAMIDGSATMMPSYLLQNDDQ